MSFVRDAMAAFTAPGMTREKVDGAKSIAAAASKGSMSPDEAIAQLREISSTLAVAIEKSGGSRINWELILALLMCIYTIWTNQKSDADAQAALRESQTQTEVAQRMLEESQAQSESLHELATRPALQPQVQAQTSAPKNRAERRKTEALDRRAKKMNK